MDLLDDLTPDEDPNDFDYNPILGDSVVLTPKRKKKKRKRKEKEDYCPAPTFIDTRRKRTSIVLPREELLAISIEKFNDIVAQFEPLTPWQLAEVRRQRRLIKNRESAALSRKRKTQAIETLERKNEELQKEVEKLKKRLEGCYCSLEVWI